MFKYKLHQIGTPIHHVCPSIESMCWPETVSTESRTLKCGEDKVGKSLELL